MPKLIEDRLTKRRVETAALGKYEWDSEVRGFGVRVTKAGTRSFVYRYKMKPEEAKGEEGTMEPEAAKKKAGKQGYMPLGRFPALTVEKARDKAKVLAGQLNTDHRAAMEAEAEERRKAKTVTDLEAYYLGDYADSRGLRPATLRDARGVLKHVPAAFKAKAVEAITIPDVRRLHGDVRDAAKKYQANRLLAALSKMFSLAIEQGWRTGDNPCRGVKKFGEDQRWHVLSDPEVGRLLRACDAYAGYDETDPDTARNAAEAVQLLLFTAARLQEVLKAEWAQFNLEAGLWDKPSSHTKTKRQHRLELDGPALDLLRDMHERTNGRFLFPGKPVLDERGEPIERARSDLKRPWKWIAREAGLERVRLHDLRRTMASAMLTGGASLATVGKALGHTQAATTARYAQLSPSVQRKELKRAGERMARLKGTAPKATVVALRG